MPFGSFFYCLFANRYWLFFFYCLFANRFWLFFFYCLFANRFWLFFFYCLFANRYWLFLLMHILPRRGPYGAGCVFLFCANLTSLHLRFGRQAGHVFLLIGNCLSAGFYILPVLISVLPDLWERVVARYAHLTGCVFFIALTLRCQSFFFALALPPFTYVSGGRRGTSFFLFLRIEFLVLYAPHLYAGLSFNSHPL